MIKSEYMTIEIDYNPFYTIKHVGKETITQTS